MTNKLATALDINDLDEAVRRIQDALGIETGDVAAVAFSGLDDGEWATLSRERRAVWLCNWLISEVHHA